VHKLERVGGLVGNNDNTTINNSYSTGYVDGNPAGGLVGFSNNSFVNNSFWDMDTFGQTTSVGGTGKTTNEMQTISTYTDLGWDFIRELENGINNYWIILSSFNNGYPIQTWRDGFFLSDFTANSTEVYIGTSIQFTDLSYGSVMQWQWDFENDGTYDST